MPQNSGENKVEEGYPLFRLSLLADTIGAGAGEARFVNGFLRALFSSPAAKKRIEHSYLVLTQGESTTSLGSLPSDVSVVRRRFPFRLRGTRIASVFGSCLPRTSVAHGLSFYTFPFQGKRSIVTFLDASFLNSAYHVSAQRRIMLRAVSSALSRSDFIVCISDSVMAQTQQMWPDLSRKCVRIYPGVEPIRQRVITREPNENPAPFILAVGTIEPRKNYERMLDAYEYLLSSEGGKAPNLTIVGREGWMCDKTILRLRYLDRTGKVRWLKGASDDVLADCYRHASVFTYLSLYEGFGYPPFEAAYADTPLVLSSLSAVGELWSGHACCVDPTDIREIVAAWKWAVRLREEERRAVIERQKSRAMQFSWAKCVEEYVDLYAGLAGAEDWARLSAVHR